MLPCYSRARLHQVAGPRVSESFQDFRLGETRELVAVDTSDALRSAVLSLARQARQGIAIVSRHLDPALYDTAEFADALKALALSSPRAQVRAIVQDVAPIVRDGHHLVALAQRLPSFIHLRVPGPPYRDFNQAFLVADDAGYVQRDLADRYEAAVCFHAPLVARDLLRQFEAIWASAEPDPNLRALRI